MLGAEAIISVENLQKRYPEGEAVRGLSFEMLRGECFGLLGPNGAGKTTTIGMLTGLIAPSSGTILIDGLDPNRRRREVQRRIGFVPQDFAFYAALSGRENLIFFARLYGLRGDRLQRRLEQVLETVRLTSHADRSVSVYSNGMKRRLNIAIGLIHNPAILILDEPTVGIDAQSRSAILEGLEKLNREGVSLLYTTHYIQEAQRLCRRVAIMDQGKVIALDTPDRLISLIGTSIIRMQSARAVPERVAEEIARWGEVHFEDSERKVLHLKAAESAAAALGLLDIAGRADLPLRRIDILEANLESVFLHLTGKSLRD